MNASKAIRKFDGTCVLCGVLGPLSFEHTPARAAFNSSAVVKMSPEFVLYNKKPLAYLDAPEGHVAQKGAGGFTLCNSCNSWTGSKYASHYQDLCHQVMQVANSALEGHGIAFEVEFCPLNVLKQIALMFLTSNSPQFREKNLDLVSFVNAPNSRTLPRRFKFLMALTSMQNAKFSRSSGILARVDLDSQISYLYSEVAFPPIVNVMTISSSPPDQRLTKINWFRHYDFNSRVRLQLSLFALPVASPFPADYRGESQVRTDVAESYRGFPDE